MRFTFPAEVLSGSLLLLALVLPGCDDRLSRGSGAAAESAEAVVRSSGSTGDPSSVADSQSASVAELEHREARVAQLERDLEARVEALESRLATAAQRAEDAAVEQPRREKAVEVERPREDEVLVAREAIPAPPPEPVPSVVTILLPNETVVPVAFEETVSSRTNQVGDRVRARVTRNVFWRGYIAIPAESEVLGTVTSVNRQKKIGGQAHLTLQFDSIILPTGEPLPIRASFHGEGKKQAKKDAATIGGSTAGGAILGRVLGGDGNRGTAIGAVIGAAVGTVVASKNAGDPISVEAGTLLDLILESPLEVTVTRQSGTAVVASARY